MIAAILAIALAGGKLDAPKQPVFGLTHIWRVKNLREADEILIKSEYYRDILPQWVHLYGIDVPNPSQRGYSGARQDLEILLGRSGEVYVEDEKPGHTVIHSSTYYQYMWAWGNLLQFELVRDGWAKVNDDGRKGRYGKYLIAAEDEAKRSGDGIWAKR